MGLFIWLKSLGRSDGREDDVVVRWKKGGLQPTPQAELTLTENEQSGCLVLHLQGMLNSTSSPILEACLRNRLENNQVRLVLDFSGVRYVSSQGWGVLISLLKQVRNQQGDFKLAALSESVAQQFHHAGLKTIFEDYPDVSRALDRYISDFPPASPFR